MSNFFHKKNPFNQIVFPFFWFFANIKTQCQIVLFKFQTYIMPTKRKRNHQSSADVKPGTDPLGRDKHIIFLLKTCEKG